jgi:hypothetical protein
MIRALALSAALGLAACGAQEPAAPPEAPAAPMAPTPPIPEVRSSVDTPLTAEGWGPLKVGMTIAEITAALGPDSDPAVGGPDPDICDQFRPARAPEGLLVMVEQGRLSRISLIRTSALKTDRGFGLGDTAAAIKAAYGPLAVASPHKYEDAPAEYITAWRGRPPAADAPMPPDARGIVYEVGTDGRVRQIHAGGPSIGYVEGCS